METMIQILKKMEKDLTDFNDENKAILTNHDNIIIRIKNEEYIFDINGKLIGASNKN
jgi:hypothetical protein